MTHQQIRNEFLKKFATLHDVLMYKGQLKEHYALLNTDNADEIADYWLSLLTKEREELKKKVEGMKRLTKSQIKMPNFLNPDRIEDVVYAAQHNITDAYNQALSDILSLITKEEI